MNAAINTQATMMHFLIWLPNWNSLDSVRRAHNELEGAALLFFALLVVAEALAHLTDNKKRERGFDKIGILFFAIAVFAEIAAYPYGQRNDTLSEQIIGSLDTKAGDAANKAAKSLTDSGTAISQAGEAKTRVGDALKKAVHAQEKATAVGEQATELDRRLTASNAQLNTVDAKRRELDQSLTNLAICNAPRLITNWYVHGKTWVDPLIPLAGTRGLVEYVRDAEARRAAFQIGATLKAAGWDATITPTHENETIRDGVMIKSYLAPFPPQPEKVDNRTPSLYAAKTVVNFLHSYFWQATSMDGWSGENDIPPKGIKIEVGLYPAVAYVSPPGAKGASEIADELKRRFEEQRKQRDADIARRRDEALKGLTTKQQAALKAEWERFDALEQSRQESLWEELEQPCKPISDLNVHP
jgi:hypothetical protein